MRVLIACEFSGTVRRAFQKRGHDAWSCDLLPADDGSSHHYEGDVMEVLRGGVPWDLMIAHPPCTFLCISGIHWNNRIPGRKEKTADAVSFCRQLLDSGIPKIALENPVGCLSSQIRKPDQIIQPWQYGHDASKQTCLWLVGLPKLEPTDILTPMRFQTNGRPRWGNQTPSGQNNLGPSADRWKLRSLTYPGIAQAMAEQWG